MEVKEDDALHAERHGVGRTVDVIPSPSSLSSGMTVVPVWSRPQNSIPVLLRMPSGTSYLTVPPTNQRQILFTSVEGAKRRAPGNGLRQYALRVMTKVEQKRWTTYNEIADELVREVAYDYTSRSMSPQAEEKNIRRRVYDALNVLLALNIIRRDNKCIVWTGMPASMQEQCRQLEKEKLEYLKRMSRKKRELNDLVVQLVAFKNLIARNKARYMEEQSKANGGSSINDELRLPFIIVNTSKETVIDCWLSADRRAYRFNFDRQFEIHDDLEVLRRMGLTYGLEHGHCSADDLKAILAIMPTPVHRIVTDVMTETSNVSQSQSTSARSLSTSVQTSSAAVQSSSANENNSQTEQLSHAAAVDAAADEMDVDDDDDDDDDDVDGGDATMDQTRDDEKDKQLTTDTRQSLLPEVVEQASLDSELSLLDSIDDWLSYLPRCDDQNSTTDS